MSKQLKIKDVEKRPLYIGGVRQNCYLVDGRKDIPSPVCPNTTQKKYFSLERKNLPNGFTEEVVEKDYPINSESVSSYVESSDYRNDPMQAIANAPKRVNLGDISQVQDFIKSNPVEATRQYADILDKVSSYFKSMASKQGASVGSSSNENATSIVNKEVNNG